MVNDNGHGWEREPCEACDGTGSFAPVYFGEREAPDGRERERCEACDGTGCELVEVAA